MIFYKYHAGGNTIVIIESNDNNADSVIRISDYIYGIGCDGVIFFDKDKMVMNYYDSDGFYGDFCGNGALCLSRYVYGIYGITEFEFWCLDKKYSSVISSDKISLVFPDNISEYKLLDVNIYDMKLSFIDVGTYHVVCPYSNINIDNIPVKSLGEKIFNYNKDKYRNIDFICYYDGIVNIRTYECHIGRETLSCGTGIVSSALYYYNKGIDIPISVKTKSNALYGVDIVDNKIVLSGNAYQILKGEFNYE